MEHNLLPDVLILLSVSVFAIAIFRRMNLPAILGYLVVGIITGPNVLGLLSDSDVTRLLGEIGVAFLLFTIGLGFSIEQLMSLRKILLGLGSAQVIAGTLSGAIIAWMVGVPWRTAVIVGGALSMSSTAIVTKQLTDQFELQSQHGRLSLGILLFQDLAAIPFLVVIPPLAAGGQQFSATLLLIALVKGMLALIIMLLVGRTLLRPLFREITRTFAPELFTLTVLLVTITSAWISDLLGLSFALGAFLAGMMLSETEFKHQVETEIRPFRDILLGLFFITVGMQLNPSLLPPLWPWISLLVVGLMLGKGLLIAMLAYMGGYHPERALRTGIVMGQGGEFGIALLTLAVSNGLLAPDNNQPILAAIIITMAMAPLLIRYNSKISVRLFPDKEAQQTTRAVTEISEATHGIEDHVIICGYGDTGRNLAVPLSEEGFNYIALDIDPVRVKHAWEDGEQVFYGNATHPEMLEAAGLSKAKALVISFNDPGKARKVIHYVRSKFENLPILVRAYSDDDLELLLEEGATEGVPDTFETSQMLAVQLLLLLEVPVSNISRRIQAIRGDHYHSLQAYFSAVQPRGLSAREHVRGHLRTIIIPAGAFAENKHVEDLHLENVGVLVTAVRHPEGNDNRSEGQLLRAGDLLVVHGTVEQLNYAENIILTGISTDELKK